LPAAPPTGPIRWACRWWRCAASIPEDGVRLQLAGADLLDGTPVLDIKPYIPFVEAHPEARGGFVDGPPPCLQICWSEQALQQLAALPAPPPALVQLIEQVLAGPAPGLPGRPGTHLWCAAL
jgi:hypothetical protein